MKDIRANLWTVGQVTADLSPEEIQKFEAKVLYNPVAEVMSAWADVEGLCQTLLAKKGENVPKNYRALGSRLKRNQLIDSEHADILDKLRQVRNIAVHGAPGTVDAHEAQEYIMLSELMISYLHSQLSG